MFNTNNYSNNLKINACSGGIYKTYKESWFKRFHLRSDLSDILFKKNKCFYSEYVNKYSEKEDDYYNNKEVIVLQMVICGEMEVIAELITKEDFDKYFLDEKIGKEE